MMQHKSINAIIDPICDSCLLPGTFPLHIPFILGYLIFGDSKVRKKNANDFGINNPMVLFSPNIWAIKQKWERQLRVSE